MILAIDAGGTKTELAVYDNKAGKLNKIKKERYLSKDFSSIEEMLGKFLAGEKFEITCGCAGVAGPVINGTCISTNLTWDMDEVKIANYLKIKKFKLVNDLVAMSSSIPYMTEEDFDLIYQGKDHNANGTTVVLAPGTGLGEATIIYPISPKFLVIPSEGGHTDFAPRNEIEIRLLQFLIKKYGRGNYERVASGTGLLNIFEFLVEAEKLVPTTALLNSMNEKDPSAAISEFALSKEDPLAVNALEIFVSVLAAHAGNLVLSVTASGGVYLGGGIPAKILPLLKTPIFIEAYLSKGRLSYVVEAASVFVIKDGSAALHGAARIAENL